MGLTNAQLAEAYQANTKGQHEVAQSFAASIDRLIEHDRDNHTEFRQAITRLEAEQRHHAETIKQIRWLAMAVIIVPIGNTIFQLVINSGG